MLRLLCYSFFSQEGIMTPIARLRKCQRTEDLGLAMSPKQWRDAAAARMRAAFEKALPGLDMTAATKALNAAMPPGYEDYFKYPTIAGYCNGSRIASWEETIWLAFLLDVDLAWLYTGYGEIGRYPEHLLHGEDGWVFVDGNGRRISK